MKLIKKDREIDLPITSGCIYRQELMKEHFIRLSFEDVDNNFVEVGDYIMWRDVKYTLLKPYIPEEIELGRFRYNVELEAPEMILTQKYFVYKDVGGQAETEWNMRSPVDVWMATVSKAIKIETGVDVPYAISNLVGGSKFIEIAHDSIWGGLNKIAEAYETEWWFDGKTIHLGKLEKGDGIGLNVGYNVNVPRLEVKEDYFTRVIPLGSDRNIAKNTQAEYVNYKNRLRLDKDKYPDGYIDIIDLPIEQVVPKTFVFDDIYPKSYLKISKVITDYNKESEQYTYRVLLKDFELKEDMILPNKTPIMVFQSGLLNGREFELNVTNWLEIINQEEGGIIIPNKTLKPQIGDEVILWNIKMPDKYVKDAQEQLEYEALRIVARQSQDLNTYNLKTCPINFEGGLSVGDKVTLINNKKETKTRVLSVEYRLDNEREISISIGNERTKGFIDKLLEEAKIDEIREKVKHGKDGDSFNLKGKLGTTAHLPISPRKGDSYWIGTVLYTWNGVGWVKQDLKGETGGAGIDGSTPYIGHNGNWWIGNTDLNVKAEGADGDTPYIGHNGNWWIGDHDTGVKAKGEDGKDGEDGVKGSTPYIKDGYWWLDGENLWIKAEGEDGETPYIGYNGNWWIGDHDTGISPEGKTGPITYIAGMYSKDKTYRGTKVTRPLVYHEGRYYYLAKEGLFLDKQPDLHPDIWELAPQFEMILTNTLVANFAKVGGAVFYGDFMMSQWGIDRDGNHTTDYDQFPNNFTPIYSVNYKTGEFTANNGKLKGHIEANSGSIGGFEISSGRIGVSANPNEDEAFGNLSLQKDFLRVGGNDGYVMFGNNVIPMSVGGAFNATGRIENKTPNTGAQWGFDTSNYGLFIDVSGGTKNYGINSNAPLLAPAFIGTRVAEWNLNYSSYKIDLSQASVYVMRRRTGTVEVTMPSASSVASQFGYTKLPEGFGFVFTVVMLNTSTGGKVILKNLYDGNQNPDNFPFTRGDSATIMAYVQAGELNYHVLSYYT